MRNEPFKVQKHTGKVTAAQVIIVSNASKSVALKYTDTTTYQVGPHGDYIQEQGG